MRSMSAARNVTPWAMRPEAQARPRLAERLYPEEAKPAKTSWTRRLGLIVVGLALVAYGAVKASNKLSIHLATVETDDAQVDGHIAPVLPRSAGQVTEVLVHDHQIVTAGQVLARLDDRDLRAKSKMAQAALANAEAALAIAHANVTVAEAGRTRSDSDLARYTELLPRRDIARQQFDAAKAAARAADAQHAAALQQVAAAQAQVEQRRTDLEYADLQLSYMTLTAPAAGVITKKAVEVGQFVQAGQSLMAIAQNGDLWITANFKETQLARMRVAQTVTLFIDAYPGVELRGRVESVAPNTGARLALFPPDNATGNFTKVVQRVPVRIRLDGPGKAEAPLRIGMSVTARVKVS
jgi:membrane fusion protein (multidrug efflux system)